MKRMKLLTEIKIVPNYTETDVFDGIEKKYHLFRDEIEEFEIVKSSLDCRKKPQIFVSLNIAVRVKNKAKNKVCKLNDILVNHEGVTYQKCDFKAKRPIVVGFGPSGMFAALALAKFGLNPIVLEQGKDVDSRQKDVDEFWQNRKLNKYSNVQFGEGGAGTFSDGKLISNVSNDWTKICINEFILNGAPKDIFHSGTAHIGSDLLKTVVKNIREKIKSLGGTVLFNTKFDNFDEENGKVTKVYAKNIQTGEELDFETDSLVLAVGHSASDSYNLLNEKHVEIVPKPFAMGVRIEQLQKDINFSQYGTYDESFPAANYKLVTHLESGRSVFTFCMCPGGVVVASSSDEGTVVTNGMSYRARDGKNANSAVLVNVVPEDYDGTDALAGVRFQKKYEKLAFELGGLNYNAPAEMVKDFLSENKNPTANWGRVKPTYLPAVTPADLKKCLPDFVYKSLKEALPILNKKVKGFAEDENILIGIESRSSAPVQIVRGENMMTNIRGLFVCGEGSGYAGGITSSGADGLKTAEKVAFYLNPENA